MFLVANRLENFILVLQFIINDMTLILSIDKFKQTSTDYICINVTIINALLTLSCKPRRMQSCLSPLLVQIETQPFSRTTSNIRTSGVSAREHTRVEMRLSQPGWVFSCQILYQDWAENAFRSNPGKVPRVRKLTLHRSSLLLIYSPLPLGKQKL